MVRMLDWADLDGENDDEEGAQDSKPIEIKPHKITLIIISIQDLVENLKCGMIMLELAREYGIPDQVRNDHRGSEWIPDSPSSSFRT